MQRDKTLVEHWQEYKRIKRERESRDAPEFPTGLPTLDDLTDGLHRGELWIIAGGSGTGKTALALQIATNIADNVDYTILYLQLEMPGHELVGRMFCNMMDIQN